MQSRQVADAVWGCPAGRHHHLRSCAAPLTYNQPASDVVVTASAPPLHAIAPWCDCRHLPAGGAAPAEAPHDACLHAGRKAVERSDSRALLSAHSPSAAATCAVSAASSSTRCCCSGSCWKALTMRAGAWLPTPLPPSACCWLAAAAGPPAVPDTCRLLLRMTTAASAPCSSGLPGSSAAQLASMGVFSHASPAAAGRMQQLPAAVASSCTAPAGMLAVALAASAAALLQACALLLPVVSPRIVTSSTPARMSSTPSTPVLLSRSLKQMAPIRYE